jgi:hypothetical protein
MATDDDVKKWELEYNLNEERKVFFKKKKEEKLKQNILSVLKISSLYIIVPFLISVAGVFVLYWIISNIWTGLIINPASILNPNHYITSTYYSIFFSALGFPYLFFSVIYEELKKYGVRKIALFKIGLLIFGCIIVFFIFSYIIGLFWADYGLNNISQRGDIFDAKDYSITIAYILSGLGLIVYYIILIVKWFNW